VPPGTVIWLEKQKLRAHSHLHRQQLANSSGGTGSAFSGSGVTSGGGGGIEMSHPSSPAAAALAAVAGIIPDQQQQPQQREQLFDVEAGLAHTPPQHAKQEPPLPGAATAKATLLGPGRLRKVTFSHRGTRTSDSGVATTSPASPTAILSTGSSSGSGSSGWMRGRTRSSSSGSAAASKRLGSSSGDGAESQLQPPQPPAAAAHVLRPGRLVVRLVPHWCGAEELIAGGMVVAGSMFGDHVPDRQLANLNRVGGLLRWFQGLGGRGVGVGSP